MNATTSGLADQLKSITLYDLIHRSLNNTATDSTLTQHFNMLQFFKDAIQRNSLQIGESTHAIEKKLSDSLVLMTEEEEQINYKEPAIENDMEKLVVVK